MFVFVPDMEVSRLSFISFFFLFSASLSSSACSAFRFSLRSTFSFLALACCAAFMRALVPLGSSLLSSDSYSDVSSSSSSVSDSVDSALEGFCNFWESYVRSVSCVLLVE